MTTNLNAEIISKIDALLPQQGVRSFEAEGFKLRVRTSSAPPVKCHEPMLIYAASGSRSSWIVES